MTLWIIERVGLLVLFFLLWITLTGMAPISADALFAYAVELEQKGDYGRSATEFGRYIHFVQNFPIDELPRLEEAYFRLAMNLSENGETEASFKAFSSFGERWPSSHFIPQALLRMGSLYEDGGRFSLARQCYERLMQLYPDEKISSIGHLRLLWLALSEPVDLITARIHLAQITHPDFQNKRNLIEKEFNALEQLPEKSAQWALLWSIFFPGAGHCYLGRFKESIFSFLSNFLLIMATIQSFRKGIWVLGILLALIEIGWYSGTVFSSVNLAHRINLEMRNSWRMEHRHLFFVRDHEVFQGPSNSDVSQGDKRHPTGTMEPRSRLSAH